MDQNEERNVERNGETNHDEKSKTPASASHRNRIEEASVSKPPQADGEKPARHVWWKSAGFWQAIFSGCLVITTIVHAYYYRRQWDAMKGQLDATRIAAEAAKRAASVAETQLTYSARPWIAADLRIVGPFTFGEKVAKLQLLVTLKNVGHSVAINVNDWEDVIPLGDPLTLQPALDRQKEYCDAARSQPRRLGYPLFPNQEISHASTEVPRAAASQDSDPWTFQANREC